MSEFADRMKKIAAKLSPEAKEVVRQVLAAEHKHRFHLGARESELPEEFAMKALNIIANRMEQR